LKKNLKSEALSKKINLVFQLTRRDFIKKTVLGGGVVFLYGNLGILRIAEGGTVKNPTYYMIAVDYLKCTGCRTCEAVCSAHNHKQIVNGEKLNGLGNPYFSSIKVYGYNPDADIPSVCAMCPDNPCIGACPVEPDPQTGNKALYRDKKTFIIKSDPNRCIGCGECAKACRVGIIIPNPETNNPERMCTLCGGDPQCVKYCPYGALSMIKVDTEREFYGMKPDKIAEVLTKRWYLP
jgi:Fe-S-cluster-containing hydrogenase component 2